MWSRRTLALGLALVLIPFPGVSADTTEAQAETQAQAETEVIPLPPPGRFTPVEARLVDTRPGSQTVDGEFAGDGRLDAGSTYRFTARSDRDLRQTDLSALLRVTAVNPATNGYWTVHSCAEDRPEIASGTYAGGLTITNSTIVTASSPETISPSEICVYTSADTHLVIDLAGFFDIDVGQPERVVDTRVENGAARLLAGQETPVAAPTLANGAFVNLTVVHPDALGWLRVETCGAEAESADITFVAGQTISNFVLFPPNACLYSSTDVDVVIDNIASRPPQGDTIRENWVETSQYKFDFRLVLPRRHRTSQPQPAGTIGWVDFLPVVVAGEGMYNQVQRFPGHPDALVINATIVNPEAAGFATVYSCETPDTPPPPTATITFQAGVRQSTTTVVRRGGVFDSARLDDDGWPIARGICVYSSVDTEWVLDEIGALDLGGDPTLLIETQGHCSPYRVYPKLVVPVLPDGLYSAAIHVLQYGYATDRRFTSPAYSIMIRDLEAPVRLSASAPDGWDVELTNVEPDLVELSIRETHQSAVPPPRHEQIVPPYLEVDVPVVAVGADGTSVTAPIVFSTAAASDERC